MSRWLTNGHESLPIPGPRPLTFILSPTGGEEFSFIVPLSPLGRGFG